MREIENILEPEKNERLTLYLEEARKIQNYTDEAIRQYGSYENLPEMIKKYIGIRLTELNTLDKKYGIRQLKKSIDKEQMANKI